LCYYVSALLVITPRTYLLRIAFLPPSLWLTYCAGTKVDVTLAYNEPRLNYFNQVQIVIATYVAIRLLEWSFQRSPLIRSEATGSSSRTHSAQSREQGSNITERLRDALDLVCNLRGIGWSWSRGTYIPPVPRAYPKSKATFVGTTLGSSLFHFTVFDCIHFTIQLWSPELADPVGASLFDVALRPVERYTKAAAICVATGFIVCHGLQAAYHLAAAIGVLVFQQYPSQWPPLFDEPWKATSLADFWGRRWHQLFRRGFVAVGAKPLSKIFGRGGGVLGAFFASALLHDWATWGMGRGGEFRTVGRFFVMMGVGVVMEGVWQRFTLRRVGGWLGSVWTMLWLVGWGVGLVDAWSRRGLVASIFVPDNWRPSRVIVAGMSQMFDATDTV
ncbi:hypothetical protein GLOTRDRAFT_47126, partial [Gloeophyllum trabeum ATCC 11539]